MKRSHDMPFGAALAPGPARFRLWAPACARVSLVLHDRGESREVAMQAMAEGWYGADLDDVHAGMAYAFRVDDGAPVPDPASRAQSEDVNGASLVVDPQAFEWTDDEWRGRPWHEAVVYELHVGTFTPEGTFRAAEARLDHLVELGVSALEVMPVADFAGRRNWGYDGALAFAPDRVYGTPEDFKHLIAQCHARGLMVLLDVVYNHFGPEGNHLHRYAPQFFNPAHRTPWGAAINYDGERAGPVREFFLHNALYWIEEFHLDGLRLDAVHAIADDSPTHLVSEIAGAIARGPGRQRHVHLVLENERNEARLLRGPARATAQWNDDWHHAAHILATGETDGYYADYAARPVMHLGRALAEGFAWQGEPSAHHHGEARGEPSADLPPLVFMPFLQNHDQVGNRALGERVCALADPQALHLATATLLLAPSIPLLFMGEEFAASAPFLFFCDFHGELAGAVRDGRRREFGAFERFRDPAARAAIPDPGAEETFLRSKLDWGEASQGEHAQWLAAYRELLSIRRERIVPHLAGERFGARFEMHGSAGLAVDWTLADGARLHLRANFSAAPARGIPAAAGQPIHLVGDAGGDRFAPWSGRWSLEPP
ncbi:MAG TPA: malto-oligosyltrehalose trehalohydrolase [Usitatibacter sp.]|nr:malto-oligosyltrehalose trehalohydrolase [Usitatibacter sp.]